MAAIEVSCPVSSYSIDCGVAISDCNRKIELDFYSWDKKTTKEKLNKLDPILEILECLTDAKVKEWEAVYNEGHDAFHEEEDDE